MKLSRIFRRKKALRLYKDAAQATREATFGVSKVTVGRFTYGTKNLTLREWGEGASLKIGSFCSLASDITVVLGGNHRIDWATTFPFGHIFQETFGSHKAKGHPATNGDIVIGHDVWIGLDVTLMSGVTIGNGAVIAAGSVVTKDVGPYEVWGGHPAKLLKERFDAPIIAQLEELNWWECDLGTIKKIAPLLSQPMTQDVLDKIKAMVEDGV